jgi:hypothetical protein
MQIKASADMAALPNLETLLGLAMLHRQGGDQATDQTVRRLNDSLADSYLSRVMKGLSHVPDPQIFIHFCSGY